LRAAFFGFDDFDFSKYQPCEAAEKQFHDHIIRAIEDVMKLGQHHHQISLLRGIKLFQFYPEFFANHNHFHLHTNDAWDVISLRRSDIQRNGLYSTLIGFFDALGSVQCDYDTYASDYDCGAANLVILKRSQSCFYVTLLRVELIMQLLGCMIMR
jgi:hypothetical protein